MSSLLAKLCLLFIGVLCVQAGAPGLIISPVNCAAKYRVIPGHTACLTTSSSANVMELSNADKKALVDQHNDWRRNAIPTPVNMLKMSWDDELAMLAKKWTDSCLVYNNGRLEHDTNLHRMIPGRFTVGQNLAAGNQRFSDALAGWYAEKSDYAYGMAYSSFLKPVGHYTQMVWAKSNKLGCAQTDCGGVMVYACNYAPAGNVVPFDTPYEIGDRSDCKTIDNGLCDCGELECANGSPMDIPNCSCSCTEEHYLNTKTCKFSCGYQDKSYCGSGSFNKAGCTGPYAGSVTQKCPTLCEVCPYADPDYNDDNTTPKVNDENTTPKVIDENTTPKVIDENTTQVIDENTTQVIDENTTPKDNDDNPTPSDNDDNRTPDDDDDAASQTVVSGMALSLVILQSLYQCVNNFI